MSVDSPMIGSEKAKERSQGLDKTILNRHCNYTLRAEGGHAHVLHCVVIGPLTTHPREDRATEGHRGGGGIDAQISAIARTLQIHNTVRSVKSGEADVRSHTWHARTQYLKIHTQSCSA